MGLGLLTSRQVGRTDRWNSLPDMCFPGFGLCPSPIPKITLPGISHFPHPIPFPQWWCPLVPHPLPDCLLLVPLPQDDDLPYLGWEEGQDPCPGGQGQGGWPGQPACPTPHWPHPFPCPALPTPATWADNGRKELPAQLLYVWGWGWKALPDARGDLNYYPSLFPRADRTLGRVMGDPLCLYYLDLCLACLGGEQAWVDRPFLFFTWAGQWGSLFPGFCFPQQTSFPGEEQGSGDRQPLREEAEKPSPFFH